MIYSFNNFVPIIKKSSFIHPNATIIGNVFIGEKVYIGSSAVIRGDWGKIIIEDGCNIQENCTIHVFPGKTVRLQQNAHIGHGAVIHGANIGKNSLVGMNSVVMDEVVLGNECIVGALCFIKGEMKIPDRKLVVGNPAIIKGDISDEMIEWKSAGTKLYQQLSEECQNTLKECEPLQKIPKDRQAQLINFKPWKETKKQ